MEKEYYTMLEVADRFRVSKQAVHGWIKDGILKAERIAGKTIRIKSEDVENLRKEATYESRVD